MSRGHERERQVRRWLEQRDFWVCRAAGSLGDADLVALKAPSLADARRVLLIEVKGNLNGGPWMNFRQKERVDLAFAAQLAGGEAWLVWWPPRGEMRWFAASGWPGAVEEAEAA